MKPDKYPHLKLKRDMTPKQQKELSDAYAQLNKRKAEGEDNIYVRFVKKPQIIQSKADKKDRGKRSRDEETPPKQNAPKINLSTCLQKTRQHKGNLLERPELS
ncbi:hypothetical protein JTB14_001103 [Gonioctena quinquepunctata]|nr:hypothetical protein JTB14_001103 [Gonioctena quinquepunctata]